jgi:hypothetical protein
MSWSQITDETELDLDYWEDGLPWTDQGLWTDRFAEIADASADWVEVG